MKRLLKRWLIFLAIWLVIFVVAPLRYLAQSQLQNTIWPLTLLAGSRNASGSYVQLAQQRPDDARVWMMAADEYPFIAEKYYDNANGEFITQDVPATRIFPGQPEKEQNAEKRRRLDIVIDKFPNEAWLIAKQLKYSWGYMYGDRIGGELSDPNIMANKAAGKPSPERQSSQYGRTYPNYKPQELQRVLVLCRRGQKLEPNNAYFDWTESYFLTLAWRDKEAWQALDSAARKAQWNDHQLDEVQAQLAARELANGRPLLWEEKFTTAYAMLFPQYARYREYARIVSWQSIKAQRRGDHQEALRLIGAFAKIAAKMRDNSKFTIDRLVAIALESVVIAGATYDARQGTTPQSWRRGTPAQQTTMRFNSFNAYALAHGRPDLAKWVAQDSPKAMAGRTGFNMSSFAGTSFGTACCIVLLWTAGVLLLLTLPGCFIAWILLSLLFKNARVRHLLDWQATPQMPQEQISNRDIVTGAFACGGLNLIGYGLLGALAVAITVAGFAFAVGQSGVLSSEITAAWDSLMLFLTGSAGSGSSIWESLFYKLSPMGFMGGERNNLYYANWVLMLLPVVFGALWCMTRAVERQRNWQELDARRKWGASVNSNESDGNSVLLPGGGVLAFLKASVQGRLFQSSGVARLEERTGTSFDFMEWLIVLLRGIGIGIFCVAWTLAAFLSGSDEPLHFYLPVAVAIVTGAILYMDLLSRWRTKRADMNHRRRAARYGVKLLRESWLGWLALGSALFLLTLLLALPLRQQADAALDRFIKVGEIAALR